MSRFALNTSTIAKHPGTLPEKMEAVARAGYDGIELWARDLDAWLAEGRQLETLRAIAAERNLAVIDVMGFFAWMHDDADERAAGLAEARRNFELAAALGCPYVAAPPFGMTEVAGVPASRIAERFEALYDVAAEVSRDSGSKVEPLLEFWGHSQSLGRLEEALEVLEKIRPEARNLLADIFHMHKKGTDVEQLRRIPPEAWKLYHINDYPAHPNPAEQPDSERVMPGAGLAPFEQIRSILAELPFDGWYSLELFSADCYARDRDDVLAEGLRKMRSALGR